MPGTPARGRQTGLLIPVAAEELVGDFRRRHHAVSVAKRLPPHITVLFPFVEAADLNEGMRSELAAHFSTFEPFEGELTGVGHFDDYVWLVPEPRDRFVDLITATYKRFPEFPPYEGEGREPEPHLTIAAIHDGDNAAKVASDARPEFAPLLPFWFAVASVSLFEEGDDGTWQESSRFGLG